MAAPFRKLVRVPTTGTGRVSYDQYRYIALDLLQAVIEHFVSALDPAMGSERCQFHAQHDIGTVAVTGKTKRHCDRAGEAAVGGCSDKAGMFESTDHPGSAAGIGRRVGFRAL